MLATGDPEMDNAQSWMGRLHDPAHPSQSSEDLILAQNIDWL